MGCQQIFRITGLMIGLALSFNSGAVAGDAPLELLREGSRPPELLLDGENGGKLDGTPWDYRNYLGKIHLVFYVDPDERSDGEALEDALDAQKFKIGQVDSSALINMKATVLPNFMIGITLSAKQKKFPTTTYAKDFTKYLVKEWGLKDDAYNFIIFNKKGELIYRKTGKPSADEITAIIELIKKNLVVAGEKAKI
jgi:predicted transcriptional regulator